MPVGDKQALITEIVATVLGQTPVRRQTFPWLVNRHTREALGPYFPILDRMFVELGGDPSGLAGKSGRLLEADAYFAGPYGFIFEFDEIQHFSSARLATLRAYPKTLPLGFDAAFYQGLCTQHAVKADRYRHAKQVAEFPHAGGRTKQRAMFDCLRDFAAVHQGLKPTIRISEFEVQGIFANDGPARDRVRDILTARGI